MAAATKVIGSKPSECFQFQDPNTWYFSALPCCLPRVHCFFLMMRSYSWFEMGVQFSCKQISQLIRSRVFDLGVYAMLSSVSLILITFVRHGLH